MSAADDLQALLADEQHEVGLLDLGYWTREHGSAVLALLDDAQTVVDADPFMLRHELVALAAAVRALSEPRP